MIDIAYSCIDKMGKNNIIDIILDDNFCSLLCGGWVMILNKILFGLDFFLFLLV